MYSKAASVTAAHAAAGLVAVWAACAGVAHADPAPAPAPGPSPAASPAPAASQPAPRPGLRTTIDHDGTYTVGTDIAPGTYTTAGPLPNGTCYWKRTGNPDGALVDNAISKRPQVVSIEATDKAFKTDGCQPWQLNPGATPPPTNPPAGVEGTLAVLNGLLGHNGPPPPPQSPQSPQSPQAPGQSPQSPQAPGQPPQAPQAPGQPPQAPQASPPPAPPQP